MLRDEATGRIVTLAILAVVTLFAALAANMARDDAYLVNALVVMLTAGGLFLYRIRAFDKPLYVDDGTGYVDGPIRVATLATILWGVVGFLAGTYIAFQLAFPELNWGLSYTSFGRLRPLHTSAVIFAFGGSALLASSLY
ncbi:MAG: cbb3-type cytochrome c oxidase subunit I, partial [Pseudomonadota bacterium]